MTADGAGREPFERTLGSFGERRTTMTQVDLRVDPATSQLRSRRLPFELPLESNTWKSSSGVQTLWLGPDEWLLVTHSGAGRAATLIGEIGAALGSAHHSAVDVSAARTVFELWGAERYDVLAAGCGLDLHERSWRPGTCAQTLLARVPMLLQEHDGMTRLFVRSSLERYLVTWLERSRPAT